MAPDRSSARPSAPLEFPRIPPGSAICVIRNRLRLLPDHPHSWQGQAFDFTDVTFDGGDFRGVMFFGGTVDFGGMSVSGGTVTFRGATFSGGTVDRQLSPKDQWPTRDQCRGGR